MQLGRPLDVKQHELETEPVCELARDTYGTVRKRARAPIAPHTTMGTEATWSEHAAASPKD